MIDAESTRQQVETTSDCTAEVTCDPFDQVAEDFLERCRRGESPSISEYEARYPEHAEAIRKLLPSVAMMEQLKRRHRLLREKEDDPAEAMPDRLG